MIITYATTLRSGGKTITIPNSASDLNQADLLSYIQNCCLLDYNQGITFPHDHLKDPSKIMLLMVIGI